MKNPWGVLVATSESCGIMGEPAVFLYWTAQLAGWRTHCIDSIPLADMFS